MQFDSLCRSEKIFRSGVKDLAELIERYNLDEVAKKIVGQEIDFAVVSGWVWLKSLWDLLNDGQDSADRP